MLVFDNGVQYFLGILIIYIIFWQISKIFISHEDLLLLLYGHGIQMLWGTTFEKVLMIY